jgi:hypothetical protein
MGLPTCVLSELIVCFYTLVYLLINLYYVYSVELNGFPSIFYVNENYSIPKVLSASSTLSTISSSPSRP